MLSYTAEVFYAFLEEYNLAIWPAQIVALGLAFVGYFLCVMRSPFSGWTLTGILVLFWTWNAVIFFWFQFGEIDFSAPIYAGFFALQAVLLIFAGFRRRGLAFTLARGPRGAIGHALILFAIAGYPLTMTALDHPWAAVETVGTAPAPTVIFTLGLFLLTDPRPPWYLIVIPLAAAAVLGANAWFLEMPEQLSAPAAGLLFLIAILSKSRGKSAVNQ